LRSHGGIVADLAKAPPVWVTRRVAPPDRSGACLGRGGMGRSCAGTRAIPARLQERGRSMASFGKLLVFFGIGSAVLHLFDYEFKLLMWIDDWGPQVGWGIRIGMVVVGAVLWVASATGKKEDAGPAPTA
jgi:hypothetical protein